MLKKLLLILFCLSSFVFAQSKKQLELRKTEKEIKIDGIIDETWSEADSAVGFFQMQPYYAADPANPTIAKVLATDESLYCLIVCYDDLENIQIQKGIHDNFSGDAVSLMLDTFGDNTTAYKFVVSASGVKSDCRLLDDARNRDYNWDGVWFAESKVYDWGFVVEMEIPYKTIQYDEALTNWGLDFDRWNPKRSEDLYWCEYDQSEGQRISKFGRLNLGDFKPTITGANLEVYPVAISKMNYNENEEYDFEANAGLDLFYNPSQKLKYQLTVNPDFAQIEADPFDFNISRYESYFSEKRPFFTEGNEVFMASGKERGSGFYSPMELFYSRRIGKKLPDGSEVPLILGTKAFGRLNGIEYGGLLAVTGEESYSDEDGKYKEQQAYFGVARIKTQIMENSSIGLLFVGKHDKDNDYGVLDIDGAFRGSDWQLAYQLAGSQSGDKTGFALSAGYRSVTDNWIMLGKTRHVGEDFDVDQIGFVPWQGTTSFTYLTGPRWLYDTGALRQFMIYGGVSLDHEKADEYTDHSGVLGFNFQFRRNWGMEINLSGGSSKDSDVKYDSYSVNLSSWYNIDPDWSGNLYGGFERTYNFSREYLAYYSWLGISYSWQALTTLRLGTSYDMFIEGNPDNEVEDITYNARPYISLTPINNMNMRLYVDNVFVRSTDKLERVIVGFLFSYNFSPKSWIYLAVNELQDRSEEYDAQGNPLPRRMHVRDRAGVFKINYLYYF